MANVNSFVAFVIVIFADLSTAVIAGNNEPSCNWQKINTPANNNNNNNSPTSSDDNRDSVFLQCTVRTISNADSVLTNLTSTQMDRITKFHLKCSDALLFESSLENSFLTQLRRLHELKLELCKIRYVPPAVLSPSRELRNLTVRTHNIDWSAMSLEFHSDSFRGLPHLKYLDLSDNKVWSLPKELFCPLHTLTYLNLSFNRLQNVFELGFSDWGDGPTAPGKTCNVGLEVADLSNNEFTSLPDNGFTSLRSLQRLYLQNNAVNSIAERAFVGLTALNFLNASNNRLSVLPPELFHSTRNLKEVYLFNNSISILAAGLLEGLDQLVILDMSRNELTSSFVNKDTFSGLIRLVVLNVGHNQLTKVDALTFHELVSLQILNLEHNKIESIAEKAFATLNNLHALTLSYNNLLAIEAYHFERLFAINQLFLDHNRIVRIDGKSFENCSSLHDLGLRGNQLREIPDCLNQLRFLKTLDLGGNRIDRVANSSFRGLDHLYNLILSGNQIVNISRQAFSTLPVLEVLDLNLNKVEHIDEGAFAAGAGGSMLHAIRLDANRLKDINGPFVALTSLVWLNISDNQILWFDYSFIPPSLEWLDMRKNNIADLGNYLEKRESLQIKTLDVSYNNLTEIGDTSIPDSVENLFLNNNAIRKVKINTFLRKANLSRVILFDNEIRTIDMSSLRLDPVPSDKELPQFYISENPFVCDCTMEWLQRVNSLSVIQRQYPRVMDVDAAVCHVVYGRTALPSAVVRSLTDLRPAQFLCPYESHCFAVCECCDYDACDCEMTCPANCSCYHDHLWTSNVVDCSNAGYVTVPSRIPMDATEIYLDGNDLAELGSHVFIGKKRLQVLYLNNSAITTLHNKTFNGVADLRVLHLEDNRLESLYGYEFNDVERITDLYLDNNKLKTVAGNSFKPLKHLETLHLAGNNLDSFTALEQINSSRLTALSTDGNSWSCECDSVRKLTGWLKTLNNNNNMNNNDNFLLQSLEVKCASTASGDDKLTIATAIKKCSSSGDDRQINGMISMSSSGNSDRTEDPSYSSLDFRNDYVPFVAASLLVFIVVFLVTTLAFIFRHDIKLWLHSRYGVRVLNGSTCDLDADRLYDGYMVYSIKDDEFVNQVVCASLERMGYSLCLHYRDIHVSTPAYLTDSMIGASEAARRTILLFSLSFLQNEWERPVFRNALQTCLERTSQSSSRRHHKAILILTTNVVLNAELQSVLKSCHVLSWGEKRFWEKLRYLMPDIRDRRRQTSTAAGGIVVVDLKKKSSDKLGMNASARYTTAPTSLDTAWYKMSPAASLTQSSVPTQSSCVSEESSQRTTTDEDEDPAQHSYMTIEYQQQPPPAPRHNKMVHHHVYSSIPDPIYNAGNGRTYFV